ncbi:MAG: hypothetical protein KDA61_17440 [Planctomycetales bacterium]|nr:hypothetical protein [Planctomycetales bacterium]
MSLRFITPTYHAYLDYPVAAGLIVSALATPLGRTNSAAMLLALGVGIAAFVLTTLTDHALGIWRVLPYWFHLAVDFIVGLTFVAAPSTLGFRGFDAWFFWLNGIAVLTVVALHRPQPETFDQQDHCMA